MSGTKVRMVVRGALAVAVALVVLQVTRPARAACAPIAQQHRTANVFAIAAEAWSTQAGPGWSTLTTSTAYGQSFMRAGPVGGVLTYLVQFRTPGTYKLHVRVRGNSGGSNSFHLPRGSDLEFGGLDPDYAISFGQVGAWEWYTDSTLVYTIGPAEVNRPLRFRVRSREQGADLDQIFFTRTDMPAGPVVVEAEGYVSLTSTNGWSSQTDALAFQRRGIKAISAPPAGQSKYATYLVSFPASGPYKLYARVRASNSNSDSFFFATALDSTSAPTNWFDIFETGAWGWTSEIVTINVNPNQVGGVHEFRVGVREANAELDTLIFSPTSLTAALRDVASGYREAEHAGHSGLDELTHAGASGSKRLSPIGMTGDYLIWGAMLPASEYLIRYSLETAESKQASLYLKAVGAADFVDVDTVVFAPTGSLDTYGTLRVRIPPSFIGGEVMLRIDNDDRIVNLGASSASIDRISLDEPGVQCLVTSTTELDQAVSSMQAGDTVMVAAGSSVGGAIVLEQNGTADLPLVIRGELRPGLDSTFASRPALKVTGDHVTLMDLVLMQDGWTVAPDCDAGSPCRVISLEGDYDRVSHVWVDRTQPCPEGVLCPDGFFRILSLGGLHQRVDHSAINAQQSLGNPVHITKDARYSHVSRNYFGNRPGPAGNGYGFLQIGTQYEDSASATQAIVSENYFENWMTHDPTGPNGEIEVVSIKTSWNRFMHNRFWNVNKDFTLRSGNNAVVYGNKFERSGSLRVFGSGHMLLNNEFDHAGSENPGHPAIIIGFGRPADVPSPTGCFGARYDKADNLVVGFNTFISTPTAISVNTPNSGKCEPPVNVQVANNLCWTEQPGECSVVYEIGWNDGAGDWYRDIDGEQFVPLTVGAGLSYSRNLLHLATYTLSGFAPGPFPSYFGPGDTGVDTTFNWGDQEDAADMTMGRTFGISGDVHGRYRPNVAGSDPFDVGASLYPSSSPVLVPEFNEDNTGPTWWFGPLTTFP